jgi:hypothetical protein
MPKVAIDFVGAGLVPALRVRDEADKFYRVELVNGKGQFDATVDQRYRFFWLVVGWPSTQYSITLAAPTGHILDIKRNPIKAKVPSGQAGFGREPFVVKVKP